MVIKGDFTEKSILAFTQTFRNDNGLYKLKPLGQLRRIGYYFQVLHQSCDFQLNVELTHANCIHLHGLISIRDSHVYHNTTYPLLKSYGHVLIKSIDNMEKWLAYCEKEQKEIKAVFPARFKFPLTNDNYPQVFNIKKKMFKEITEWALEEREMSLAFAQAVLYTTTPLNILADDYHINIDEYES